MTPAWLLDIFAALILAVAVASAARLAVAGPWRRDMGAREIDIAHLLMGIAMAGMLTPSLSVLPDGAWDIIIGALTAWFVFRPAGDFRRRSVRVRVFVRRAPLLLHLSAMLYMLLALPALTAAGSGMGGMGGPSGSPLHYPTLAFVFAVLLVGSTVWDVDRLSGGHCVMAGSSGVLLSVRTTLGCRIVTGVTMALMLLIMI
jgi:hypothetical protein